MTNFQGDRGANRLATNNERELVPYFIEDTTGQQVVNENLQMQGKGSKNKGGNQTSVNQKAAASNRATPSRTFAVQQKTPPPAAAGKPAAVAKVVKHDKWAGGAFLNSPAPSTLPMPSIVLPGAAGGVGQMAFMDPAIVTSQEMVSTNIQPFTPPVLLSPGARVKAQFLDGEWYDGTIHGNFPSGHLVLFDGFESEGAYEITFDRIQPYMPQRSQKSQTEALASPPPPTSLADLEKQLLSSSSSRAPDNTGSNLLLQQAPHTASPMGAAQIRTTRLAGTNPGGAGRFPPPPMPAGMASGAGIMAMLGQAPPPPTTLASAGSNIMSMLGQAPPCHETGGGKDILAVLRQAAAAAEAQQAQAPPPPPVLQMAPPPPPTPAVDQELLMLLMKGTQVTSTPVVPAPAPAAPTQQHAAAGGSTYTLQQLQHAQQLPITGTSAQPRASHQFHDQQAYDGRAVQAESHVHAPAPAQQTTASGQRKNIAIPGGIAVGVLPHRKPSSSLLAAAMSTA